MMMMIIWGGKGNGPLLGLCLFAIDLLKMSFWGPVWPLTFFGPCLAFGVFGCLLQPFDLLTFCDLVGLRGPFDIFLGPVWPLGPFGSF